MPFDPNQPRDEIGRWTDTGIEVATEIHTNMDATRGLQGAASDEIAIMMWRALESGAEVDAAAKQIAAEFDNATVTPINYKDRESMERKARDDYDGDASQIKDAVRNTIMVEYKDLEKVAERLRADPRVIKVKIQEGEGYYGYKGVLANIRTANGLVAEIQANSPGMIYAKEKPKKAINYIGEERHKQIAAKTGIPGGRGHQLYDEIRVIIPRTATPEQLEKRKSLVEESERYYRNFYGI